MSKDKILNVIFECIVMLLSIYLGYQFHYHYVSEIIANFNIANEVFVIFVMINVIVMFHTILRLILFNNIFKIEYYFNQEFDYNVVLKSIWSLSGYKKLVCEKCGSEYRVSMSSRLLLGLFMVIIVVVCPMINLEVVYKIGLFLFLSIMMILCSPLLIKLEKVSSSNTKV